MASSGVSMALAGVASVVSVEVGVKMVMLVVGLAGHPQATTTWSRWRVR